MSSTQEDHGRWWRIIVSFYGWIVAIVLLLAGLYAWPLSIFGPEYSWIPGDLGDARFNNYILEHFYQFISGATESFWNIPSMYPYKNVMALSDNHLGTGLIYSAFRSVGLDRENAFQLWILCMYAFNYLCAFLAFHKWTENKVLAACGAFVFAFGLHLVGHVGHVQMLPRFMMPLVVVWVWRWMRHRRPYHLALALLGLALQFYCAVYLGFILLYALLALALVNAVVHFGQVKELWAAIKNNWLPHVMVLLIAVALMLPLAIPYLNSLDAVGPRTYEEVSQTIPRWQGYFFTHIASENWRDLSLHGKKTMPDWWHQFHFSGILPLLGLLLALVLLFLKRTSSRRVPLTLVMALTVSLLFCMDLGGRSLYYFIYQIPGFSALRSLDRMVQAQILLLLFTGLWAASNIQLPRYLKVFLALALPVAVVLENKIDVDELKRFDKHEARKQVNLVAKHLEMYWHEDAKAIAYMPVLNWAKVQGDPSIVFVETHLNAMLAGQELGIPVVNGYSGAQPLNFSEFFYALDRATLVDWLKVNSYDEYDVVEVSNLHEPYLQAEYITLSLDNGSYLTTDTHSESWAYTTVEPEPGMQYFRFIELRDRQIALLGPTMDLLCAEIDEEAQLSATGKELGDFGKFRWQEIQPGQGALMAFNGKYIAQDPNGLFYARADSVQQATYFNLKRFGLFPPRDL